MVIITELNCYAILLLLHLYRRPTPTTGRSRTNAYNTLTVILFCFCSHFPNTYTLPFLYSFNAHTTTT